MSLTTPISIQYAKSGFENAVLYYSNLRSFSLNIKARNGQHQLYSKELFHELVSVQFVVVLWHKRQ